jgi:1,4-alpha-glucan branching enzyme
MHKMIRLITIALGGEAYLNFMGNEFGHPEWIDFPRKENGWSYFYARRQWSLMKNPRLKYRFLAEFDRSMIQLSTKFRLMSADYPLQLNVDEANKTLIFERADLIFVFNWHPAHSIPDYHFHLPDSGVYRLLFNSDDARFGGFSRVDSKTEYHTRKVKGQNILSIYNVSRSAMIFEKVR